MDAAYDLSRFIVSLKYEDIPDTAINVIKKQILDILANAIGGSGDYTVQAIHELVKGWGGSKESTIFGYGTRVPRPERRTCKQYNVLLP